MALVGHIVRHANMFRGTGRHVLICVDGGGVGGPVVDRLRQLSFDATDVQFGSRAFDFKKYANRRAEIWV